MLKHRLAGLEPKYQQMIIGQSLATNLDRKVLHHGFSEQVEVVSYPDEEVFLIKIFRLDPEGEILFAGANRKGIEFIRIRIRFPSEFSFSGGLGQKKRLLNFKSPEELVERSGALLEEILFLSWSRTHS